MSASPCLNAGKHVHSEKPLGVNMVEARKVMDLAGEEGSARRLRAGHLPRRRPPDRAQADRRRRHRHAGRRHRLLHVPRPRALAPGARLLLSARRRADARHGPLLHHRPGQAARPGRLASWARPRSRARERTDHQRAARTARSSRSRSRPTSPARSNSSSGAVVSIAMSFDVPKHRHAPIEIYGTEGSLLRARSEPVRRRGGVGQDRRRVGDDAAHATAMPTASSARSASPTWRPPFVNKRAAPRQRRAGAACARGDGGVPDLVRRRAAA